MGRPRPRTEALQLEQECGGSGWWAVSVDSLCRGSYYVYEVGLAEDVAAAAAIATATVVAVAVAAAASSSRRPVVVVVVFLFCFGNACDTPLAAVFPKRWQSSLEDFNIATMSHTVLNSALQTSQSPVRVPAS